MQSISRNQLNQMSILSLIVGAVFLVISGVLTLPTYRLITMASRAEGKIVRITARNLDPVVQFVPAGASAPVEFLITGLPTKLIHNYAVGDQVSVLYLVSAECPPDAPQTSIDTIDALWSVQAFYAVLSLSAISHGLRLKRMASRQT